MFEFELSLLQLLREFDCCYQLHFFTIGHSFKHFGIEIIGLIRFQFDCLQQFLLSFNLFINCTLLFHQFLDLLLGLLDRIRGFDIYTLSLSNSQSLEIKLDSFYNHQKFRNRMMILIKFIENEELKNKLNFSQILDYFCCAHPVRCLLFRIPIDLHTQIIIIIIITQLTSFYFYQRLFLQTLFLFIHLIGRSCYFTLKLVTYHRCKTAKYIILILLHLSKNNIKKNNVGHSNSVKKLHSKVSFKIKPFIIKYQVSFQFTAIFTSKHNLATKIINNYMEFFISEKGKPVEFTIQYSETQVGLDYQSELYDLFEDQYPGILLPVENIDSWLEQPKKLSFPIPYIIRAYRNNKEKYQVRFAISKLYQPQSQHQAHKKKPSTKQRKNIRIPKQNQQQKQIQKNQYNLGDRNKIQVFLLFFNFIDIYLLYFIEFFDFQHQGYNSFSIAQIYIKIMFALQRLLVLLFPILSTSLITVNQSQCSTYYSDVNATQPPLNCTNSTCTFSIGISKFITNSSKTTPFVLCLYLPGYDITINEADSQNNTYVEAISSVYIYGSNVTMNQDYSLICQRNLVIVSQTNITFDQVSLTGQKIIVEAADYILVNGSTFINESVVQTQCSCSTLGKPCAPWNFSYPDLYDEYGTFTNNISQQINNMSELLINTATFLSQYGLYINSTTIKYSIIGLFSQNIYTSSSYITTSGLGYPSDSGPGCGYFDEVLNQLLGCMGSGGSHGGFGGNSSPRNCYLLVSKPPYGDVSFPNTPGSGGGFFLPHSRQSSSGGGVINVQCINLTFSQTSVLAQGKNGIQGGGGGAGGTISLNYRLLNAVGLQTVVSVNGGNGDKMSSSGSGGRIRLWNYNWRQQNASTPNMTITVAGGSGCRTTSEYNFTIQLSCGQNGSVFTSPCKPGTALNSAYICLACPQGYYQINYGYSECIKCPPLPPNSNWLNIQNLTDFEYSCNHTCKSGYNPYYGKCLTSTQIFMAKYNVLDILISLGMIGIAVVIYLFIIFIKKLTQQEAILSFDDPNLNEAFRKKFFRLEDLPYHEMRLYFTGQNHPFNPWQITEQAENSFYSQMRSPVTKINHIISKVIKQINKKSQYKRFQKIVLTVLTYSYYPFSRIILSSMRRQKAREIFDEVNKYNSKIPEYELLGIKLHVKPQETVASLEIFNYTKSVLDFYIENYFPLYILLEKAPFGGHIIDFSDPFLKVFINQIVQKQVAGKSVENFLKQANKFLKNQAKLLSCLNYLWTLNDINPKFQAFLWQPPNQILGIDRKYKINKKEQLFLIISSQNLSNSHFLLNDKLPSPYMPQIQSLKHKFNIRKDLATEQDGNSIWIINNEIGQKTLLWIFGFFTTVFLLLTIATFFINLLIMTGNLNAFNCKPPQNNIGYWWYQFSYGFIVYFALWPLCDFAAAFLNFKTMLTKDEYVLEDAIAFNILTILKSLILFIIVLVFILGPSNSQSCLQIDEYFWLAMIILGIIIFIIQIMLRARVIALTK